MTLPITRKSLLAADSEPNSPIPNQRPDSSASLADTDSSSSGGASVSSSEKEGAPTIEASDVHGGDDPAKEESVPNFETSADTSTIAGTEEETRRMKRFLTSSILAIPWTYEGIHHSPEALTADNSELSVEERQLLIKEAEEDSIVLANTVCALAEFISSLPEGTTELKICFACNDRVERDALALSIRSLVCLPAHFTRLQRMQGTFPWLFVQHQQQQIDEDDEDNNRKQPERIQFLEDEQQNSQSDSVVKRSIRTNALVGISNQSELQTKKRLKQLEEETVNLKRERNELSLQLLQAREDILKLNSSISSNKADSNNTNLNHNAELDAAVSSERLQSVDDGSQLSQYGIPTELEAGDTLNKSNSEDTQDGTLNRQQQQRQLLSKVIELENKVNINAKKELEWNRQRAELEARNAKLQSEVDRLRGHSDDVNSRLASVQSLYDRQLHSIQLLEDDQQRNKTELADMAMKIRQLKSLEEILAEKESSIQSLRDQLELISHRMKSVAQSEIELKEENVRLLKSLDDSHTRHTLELKEMENKHLKQALDISEKDLQLLQLAEAIASKDKQLAENAHLHVELQEAERRADTLAGEIKHLQRKSESQTQELKKTMRENAAALAEFERALVRKSEECNDLYFKINKLRDEAAAAKATPFGEHGLFSSAIANTLISSGVTKSSSSHGENDNSNSVVATTGGGETVFSGFLRKLSITASTQISASNIPNATSNNFANIRRTKDNEEK